MTFGCFLLACPRKWCIDWVAKKNTSGVHTPSDCRYLGQVSCGLGDGHQSIRFTIPSKLPLRMDDCKPYTMFDPTYDEI